MEDKTLEVKTMEDNPIQDSTDNPIQDSTSTDSTSTDSVNAPARPKGPNGAAIVLGLVAMIIAGLIFASETMRLRVDWLALGPAGIVGVGAVLVVLGAVGLVRHRDDG